MAAAIGRFFRLPGHSFWPDDVSIFDTRHIDINRIAISGQVTDAYLVALAKAQGGQLATFDRRLSTNAIEDGDRYVVQVAAG